MTRPRFMVRFMEPSVKSCPDNRRCRSRHTGQSEHVEDRGFDVGSPAFREWNLRPLAEQGVGCYAAPTGLCRAFFTKRT